MAIHPTAIIDPNAEIDSIVEVGPYCVIDAHVRVAKNCRLFHGVYLTGWTQIGEGCVIHPGAVVGHEPQDIKYGGDRSYCRIGKNTIIREYVIIHRGTIPDSETVLGNECFLLAGSHVGHNCCVGNNVTLINNVLLGGHVEVGDHVTMGGGAKVHQFVRIGEYAMVAGNSRVGRDVIPFGLTDLEGKIVGFNRVGLKRSDMPKEHIDDIRGAYKVLMSGESSFQDTVERLAQDVCTPAGQRLVQFLRMDSRRGVAGRSRSKSRKSFSPTDDNPE